MFAFLRPRPTLTGGEVQLSLRMMIWEAVVSGSMFTLGSGGFMAAYALALGANNLQIGVLAALPLIAQVVQLPAITLAGFDFLFTIVFVLGLCSLNLLVALREEGEVSRDAALTEMMAGLGPMARAVSSVPGLGILSEVSYGYLRRVPGADVAIGVMAYQLASFTQAAVSSVARGQTFVRDVGSRVGAALSETIEGMGDITEHGLELARHATRGAVHVGDDVTGQFGRIAHGAVVGTVRTLAAHPVVLRDVLRGAGYGAVQGAWEAGKDPAQAAVSSLEWAREVAAELGVSGDEATGFLAAGLLDAAGAAGEEVFASVREAVPLRLTQLEPPSEHDGDQFSTSA